MTLREITFNDQPKSVSWRWDVHILASLFVIALGLYSLEWYESLRWGGVSTVGAERVLRGDIPYRDFWTMYAPGHFYLLALLFKIFGSHLIVEVVAASLTSAAGACILYIFVINLCGRKVAALACTGIFLAAMYKTGYFRSLGTYPPAMLCIFIALNSMVLFYKTHAIKHLFAAGLASGAGAVFKHDVGGYTGIAIVTGLAVHCFLTRQTTGESKYSLTMKVGVYAAGSAAVLVPVFGYFFILAGKDMLKDLFIFPLTVFPASRGGGGYPNPASLDIYALGLFKMASNLSRFVMLTMPLMGFLLGPASIVLAMRKSRHEYVAISVAFSVLFLLHFVAGLVELNTHIISMSVYAAVLGVLLYHHVVHHCYKKHATCIVKLVAIVCIVSWLLSLSVVPIFKLWKHRQSETATMTLNLPKVSGHKASQKQGQILQDLLAYIDSQIPRGQELFVGLNRHDVLVANNVEAYFLLDRPSATRYQVLHPAVVDTAEVQQEIIHDLGSKEIPLIVLYDFFSDDALRRVKECCRMDLPEGAILLDEFIRRRYVEVRKFGKYHVLKRTNATDSSQLNL